MNGSGSEPTYLPFTNTSCAGLVLYVLGAANALDAMAMVMVIASAVLVNMVYLLRLVGYTSSVCAHLEPARWCRESPGGPTTGHRDTRIDCRLEGLYRC